ncbi:hypothetical protein DL768_003363 [Monosporascus sp. mg162]|nr:hypothetical protein DL768_003363 [Monosporascus sp. mg162]
MLQICGSILQVCYNTRAILKTKPWGLSHVQDEIRDLRGVLETLFQLSVDDDLKVNHNRKSSIRMLAQNQQGDPLKHCLDDLRGLEKILLAKYTNEPHQTQREILKWLSPVDYQSSYASAVNRCYAGTGHWLLETPAFRSWRDGRGPNLLWLSGSNAVRSLTVWAGKEKSRPQVAYFFCDFRNANSQDVAVLMGSIVSQLIVQSGSIPGPVEEAFQTSTVAGTYRNPEISFLVDVLELLTYQSRALVLINGVDEVEERRDLLSFLQQTCRPQSNVRILVSSREEQDLRESLGDVHNIRIEERISQVDDDISRYLNGRLQFDPRLQWLKPHIRDDIRVSVEQHACGIAIAVEWGIDYLDEESLLRSPLDVFSLTGGLVGLSDQGHVINADNPFSWDFYPRHATDLYYAATFGLADVVKTLIDSNTPLDLPGSRYGGTALHGAVYRLRLPVVRLLLKAGADINRPDFLGVSPLHTAATLGSLDLVKLMLRYSADATALDGMGETPVDWAEKSGQLNISECLQGSAALYETAAEDPQSDTFWRASKMTIPYFPDFHRRRSGVECSVILKVQIGTRTITEEELPEASYCSLASVDTLSRRCAGTI